MGRRKKNMTVTPVANCSYYMLQLWKRTEIHARNCDVLSQSSSLWAERVPAALHPLRLGLDIVNVLSSNCYSSAPYLMQTVIFPFTDVSRKNWKILVEQQQFVTGEVFALNNWSKAKTELLFWQLSGACLWLSWTIKCWEVCVFIINCLNLNGNCQYFYPNHWKWHVQF